MMIIHINEDGSALLRTAGYTVYYDKEGVRTGACGHLESVPESVIIHNEFKSKADKAQVSRTVDGFIKVSD
ncbi:hypothetical protein [Xenorhabdus sp. KJ12.1]|uniref:hypothetical protein n=1 Tax=Xenorhabdus sp. KJ12.1 TaxID=1851571 RepID=UPI000C03BF63|nr:hypothetical protein [Xenorhabdus sp. KJ12.1]